MTTSGKLDISTLSQWLFTSLILKINCCWRKKNYDKFLAERNNEINSLNNKNVINETNYFKSEDRTPISFNGLNQPLSLTR